MIREPEPCGRYGTYAYTVQSRVDVFDKNVVLGLFTWDTKAPEHHYREIDFEFGRWGIDKNDNAQFVVQPWDTPGNMYRFNIPCNGPTTHVMTWQPDGIHFESYYGVFSLCPPPENIIATWRYSSDDNPPPGGENVRMNLWLVWGTPPADGLDTEIVIGDLRYLADASLQPGDVNCNGDVDLADYSLFSDCLSGPRVASAPAGCRIKDYGRADIEGEDGDVDLADIAAFQRNFAP